MNRNVGVIAFGVLVFASPASALAGLQSALQAAMWGHPTAFYNSATGDISFSGFHQSFVQSYSGWTESLYTTTLRVDLDAGSLLADNALQPPGGQVTVFGTPPTAIEWLGVFSATTPFDAGNVVPVGTPLGNLHFSQTLIGSSTYAGKLVAVPEPSAIVIGGCAVLALAVCRGRRGNLQWRRCLDSH